MMKTILVLVVAAGLVTDFTLKPQPSPYNSKVLNSDGLRSDSIKTQNKVMREAWSERSAFRKYRKASETFDTSATALVKAFRLSGEYHSDYAFSERRGEGVIFSTTAYKKVIKILSDPGSYNQAPAACFEPRYVIVLYDKPMVPVKYISFCFDCRRFEADPGELHVKYRNKLQYGFSEEAEKRLREIFTGEGLSYKDRGNR